MEGVEGERLKVLLTSDEYEAARASTLNAHYTSAIVISAIYDGVGRIGFTQGRVLEPALGIGNFFGLLPAEMIVLSRLTGVEIDPLTVRIARQLYPAGYSPPRVRDRRVRRWLVRSSRSLTCPSATT